ncbi:MAG: GGDEF domain-containing protein [Gammaproteobacteria bacterium]|jgi:diguanylate cyclase (GGDEF)-like protein|nr:GGDEF domain-containing protein [Gammaproteobacteria bacterium]MBT3722198.1 GGDEF domain-containing protein [Gammaproteobacteria bacterium]MBT4076661.1 GGDEF domain-containing protein [Gammaproteobacteria bacterium]MBT4193515.1 GGDEF domain-containing protein [Gammaproteobacteria bacterium]MBT4452176.1 GGDEF domain-containing protein [Gammaproteobacteria bacterium]
MQQKSIASIIMLSYMIIVVFVLLVLAWMLNRSISFDNANSINNFKNHLHDISTIMSVEYEHSRKLSNQIARHPKLKALIESDDPFDIENWTINTRQLAPDVIGLAVFNTLGEIRGDPGHQRIGQSCLIDIKLLADELAVSSPPVHQDVFLPHFDIVIPIDFTKRKANFLLVSHSLDLLKAHLVKLSQPHTYYELVNAANQIVVRMGEYQSDIQFKLPVEGTDWTLVGRTRLSGNLSFRSEIWSTFTILVMLTLLLVISAAVIIRRRIQQDMQSLERHMSSLNNEKDSHYETIYFKETQKLDQFINLQMGQIQTLNKQLIDEARHDLLTGLFNRRGLNDAQNRWLSLGRRDLNVNMMLFDLDNFKQVNDSLGHAVGDIVLRKFAEILTNTVRGSDEVFRLGGDEFLVLQLGMTKEQSMQWFEKVKSLVAALSREQLESRNPQMSFGISAGCVRFSSDDDSFAAVLHRADAALYRAKENGKDQVFCDGC